tara:strand:+ start:7 stop:579 length:573 start_codon:yes stop_codon:yes gene_type:complete
MTCRGSRFADGAERNPNGSVFMKGRETKEWLKQNHRSTRNFIRKWGHFVRHDSLMKPIIPPKYDIGFVVKNCSYEHLYELEPWCSTIYIGPPVKTAYQGTLDHYFEEEQSETMIDLSKKIKDIRSEAKNDIIVEFDSNHLTPENFNVIAQLPDIISNDNELEVGEFELGIFKIKINRIKTYEENLIVCER